MDGNGDQSTKTSARYLPPTNTSASARLQNRRMSDADSRRLGSVSMAPETPVVGFYLFILLNGVLFIRPGEIIPALLDLPIYEWTILACLAVSLTAMIGQLSPASLVAQPIAVCVLGLLPATVISFLAQFSFWGILTEAWDFFKVITYFLLFISNVSSLKRLRIFLGWLLSFILVQIGRASCRERV